MLGVVSLDALDAASVAALSRTALDAPLAHDAELTVARVTSPATLVGAFQRASRDSDDALPVFRRGSGGPAVRVDEGALYILLRLADPSALVPCDARSLLNRHVRPLLRALTRAGAQASYGDRDWVAVQRRPAAEIVFAHDASTERCAVEAFVAVTAPFERAARASFGSRAPGTLESIVGRAFDPAALADSIRDAYARGFDVAAVPVTAEMPPRDLPLGREDAPWAAAVDEAIGPVAAGRDAAGVFRVGGDLVVSRDALHRLEERIADEADRDAIARAIDATLGAPGVALFGVRSLTSILEVILRARAA